MKTNFLLKKNFDNFNNDNVINGVNMDNLNYVDYENDNYEVNDNLDIENTQAAFVQTLNL